ncbi:MAG: type II toxin-antitoxin system RelE/ParE family toxin [Candidatus Bathyarchaeota archaeon]|nr:type II toxin-antitoxin system RelE/ParE family toxin [Candidatus Bathyarchaeota archaeon]
MPYKILLHPTAAKALKKLDDTNKTRIKKALTDLTLNPTKTGKPLHPSQYYSTRTGNYRAIYQIQPNQNTIIILFIGHRKNIYSDFTKLI